jgi:hypothetical protein
MNSSLEGYQVLLRGKGKEKEEEEGEDEQQ